MTAIKITKAQRVALEAARDFGNAWAYPNPENPRGWSSKPYRTSFHDMLKRMKVAGLFEGAYGEYILTDAGREALA